MCWPALAIFHIRRLIQTRLQTFLLQQYGSARARLTRQACTVKSRTGGAAKSTESLRKSHPGGISSESGNDKRKSKFMLELRSFTVKKPFLSRVGESRDSRVAAKGASSEKR